VREDIVVMDIAERQDAAARSLQPSDRDAIRQALRVLRQKIGAGMLFGGEVIDGKLFLTEFIGARTEGLRHLRLASGEGLGGSVLAQGRPIGVSDYVATDSISHENDHLILGEGLRAMLASPLRRGPVRARRLLRGPAQRRSAGGPRDRLHARRWAGLRSRGPPARRGRPARATSVQCHTRCGEA